MKVIDDNGDHVSGAGVFFNLGQAEQEVYTTDVFGNVSIKALSGSYTVGVYEELITAAFANSFSDAHQVSEWAGEAVVWVRYNRIITGKENKLLDPKGKATRAEAAMVFMRCLQS